MADSLFSVQGIKNLIDPQEGRDRALLARQQVLAAQQAASAAQQAPTMAGVPQQPQQDIPAQEVMPGRAPSIPIKELVRLKDPYNKYVLEHNLSGSNPGMPLTIEEWAQAMRDGRI